LMRQSHVPAMFAHETFYPTPNKHMHMHSCTRRPPHLPLQFPTPTRISCLGAVRHGYVQDLCSQMPATSVPLEANKMHESPRSQQIHEYPQAIKMHEPPSTNRFNQQI
jgi:hypothetical protein